MVSLKLSWFFSKILPFLTRPYVRFMSETVKHESTTRIHKIHVPIKEEKRNQMFEAANEIANYAKNTQKPPDFMFMELIFAITSKILIE